jgi:hypothetical protein
MNPLSAYPLPNNFNPRCGDLMPMAERELSAFFNAVSHLFGAEQAALSAEDWLHEVIENERLPTSTREWRSISTKVSTRIAGRVNASSLSAESQIA